jgi:hypothetical protein
MPIPGTRLISADTQAAADHIETLPEAYGLGEAEETESEC